MTLQIWDLVVGVPIRTSYGFLGWSTVSLVHDPVLDEYILLDTGGINTRHLLLRSLERLGIRPENVSKILITHLHFDHCMNIELFPRATVYVCKKELDYVYSELPQQRGDVFISRPYIDAILKSSNVIEISDGYKVHEDMVAVELPGHTPGSIGYLITSARTIFVGDAIKSLREMVTKDPVLCFDTKTKWLESLNKVLNIARIIIPGHDMRIEVRNGTVSRVGSRFTIDIELARGTTIERHELVIEP